ncbi:MAG: NAD(P)H-dependent oxidoreductase [Myxococcales bacterium]|nr:NAD(P)H-dependent oxidoreductase [Myxococcales bacterium]
MTDAIRIVGFSGSLRKGSFNSALLRAATEVVPDGASLEVLDISGLPLYNADLMLPPEKEGGAPRYPTSVEPIRDAIASAHALLIVSPEYNFSMPAVTKNVLDWASRTPSALDDKAVAFTGASPGGMGTVRGQMALRHVCVFTNMHAINKPELFVSGAPGKFDKDLKLTDGPTRESLGKLLTSLVMFARRLQSR